MMGCGRVKRFAQATLRSQNTTSELDWQTRLHLRTIVELGKLHQPQVEHSSLPTQRTTRMSLYLGSSIRTFNMRRAVETIPTAARPSAYNAPAGLRQTWPWSLAMTSVLYHEGNRAFQDEFGSRRLSDRLEERSRSQFTDDDKSFIESCIYFF